MLSVVLNKMLRKIRSLVSNYDQRFWEWLEGPSNQRPKSNRQTVDSNKSGSTKSGRGVATTSTKIQIPDPWD